MPVMTSRFSSLRRLFLSVRRSPNRASLSQGSWFLLAAVTVRMRSARARGIGFLALDGGLMVLEEGHRDRRVERAHAAPRCARFSAASCTAYRTQPGL